MRHVDAYLMRAPGFQSARDTGPQTAGKSAEGFGLIMGDGMPSPGPHHRHLETIVRRSGDVSINRPPVWLRHTPNECRVSALKRPVSAMIGELFAQGMVRKIGFCGDQQSACILVDAVHDPWPPDTADPRQTVSAMMQQGVDQRSRPIARSRMHDQTGLFVDDDDMIVLKHDIERNILGLRTGVQWLRNNGLNCLARIYAVVRLRHCPSVHRHLLRLDEGFQSTSAQIGERSGQVGVKPLAGGRFIHDRQARVVAFRNCIHDSTRSFRPKSP